jgi:hypothetical protein
MKYIQGNILDAFEQNEINVLLHQENCEGLSYFAGFAKVLHQKHPELTKLHQEYCKPKKEYVKGTILPYIVSEEPLKIIYNLYSQIYRGQPSNNKQYVDSFEVRCELLRDCLNSVKTHYTLFESGKIGLPLIASGLAADKRLKGTMADLEYFKKYIAPIVEEELKDLDVTVYYL